MHNDVHDSCFCVIVYYQLCAQHEQSCLKLERRKNLYSLCRQKYETAQYATVPAN